MIWLSRGEVCIYVEAYSLYENRLLQNYILGIKEVDGMVKSELGQISLGIIIVYFCVITCAYKEALNKYVKYGKLQVSLR